jgi:hypothetical protein
MAFEDLWPELRDEIISSVEARTKAFLDANSDAREFLRNRAERLAKVSALYVFASPEARKILQSDFVIVKQAAENELATIALEASAESKALFSHIISMAFDAAMRIVPVILKAVS